MKRSCPAVLTLLVLALLVVALAAPPAALGGTQPLPSPTLTATMASSFADVAEDTWCHDAVQYVSGNGIMKGIDPTTFAPAAPLTQAMLATVVYRLAGQPEPTGANPFTDVTEGAYYVRAATWAAEKGLLAWTTDAAFAPDTPVTREQFVVTLYRYAVLKGYDVSVGEDTNILSFDDAFDISEGMAAAFQWACGAGVVEGNGPKLSPLDSATRGQTATMLMRFLQKVVK